LIVGEWIKNNSGRTPEELLHWIYQQFRKGDFAPLYCMNTVAAPKKSTLLDEI
jgi:hypothetical protein